MDKLNQVAVKNNKLEKYYSLKGNFWSERDYDKNIFNSLKSKFSNENILLQLLVSRNIAIKDIDDFINPKLKNLLPDPHTMDDILIKSAILLKEKRLEYLEITMLMVHPLLL